MNSVMWKSFCFIITVLVRSSQQRATDLETSDTVDYSGTGSLHVFPDHVDLWKNISYIKETNCPSCRCGVSKESLGIVNGNLTSVVKYPWMAYIMKNRQFTCGGSLINNKYIMSAAHCFHYTNGYKVKPEQVTVVLYNYYKDGYTGFGVMEIIVHEKFNRHTNENDIALLRLKHEGLDIGSDSMYHSICLPYTVNDFEYYTGIVTGWGQTSEGGEISYDLREVSAPIISNTQCQRFFYKFKIPDNMMCAGFEQGGKGVCKGDSGGPLHIEVDSTYYVVGIVSWSIGCARRKYPGVYTRVTEYLDWLDDNTQDACWCLEQ